MAEEFEFKRYIREGISDSMIVSAIQEKHNIARLEKKTIFDAYFGLTNFPEGSSLRLRDEDGNLEARACVRSKLFISIY